MYVSAERSVIDVMDLNHGALLCGFAHGNTDV